MEPEALLLHSDGTSRCRLAQGPESLDMPATFDGNDADYQYMSFVSAVSFVLMDKCVAEQDQITLAAVKARVNHT